MFVAAGLSLTATLYELRQETSICLIFFPGKKSICSLKTHKGQCNECVILQPDKAQNNNDDCFCKFFFLSSACATKYSGERQF